MAPFVELEWGSKAYDLMWELKEIFDPEYLLNPGVILNKVCSKSPFPASLALPLMVSSSKLRDVCKTNGPVLLPEGPAVSHGEGISMRFF
jgi:hypothetical protein